MQTFIVKSIVRLYFLGALAVSFTHIVCAAHKVQLTGWQAFTTPFAIDGIAVIGMVLRTDKWSKATRKLGFKVQITAGMLSLVCNVFAGSTTGERIYGVVIVALFIFSEWLSDHMETAEADVERERQAKRAAATEKAKATRAANKAAEERIVKTGARKMRKQLAEITA
jgi:Protein of unknown function (DUF2637)